MASPTNARLLSVLAACPGSAANGLEFRGEGQLDCTPCFNCTHPTAFYTRRAIFRLQLHQLPGITKTLQSHNASVVLQPEYEIFKRLAAPSWKCRKSWTSCKCHYSKMQTNHVPALEPQKTATIQKQKKKQNVAKTMYCLIVPRQCEIHGVSCFKCLPLSRMSCVGAWTSGSILYDCTGSSFILASPLCSRFVQSKSYHFASKIPHWCTVRAQGDVSSLYDNLILTQ